MTQYETPGTITVIGISNRGSERGKEESGDHILSVVGREQKAKTWYGSSFPLLHSASVQNTFFFNLNNREEKVKREGHFSSLIDFSLIPPVVFVSMHSNKEI